MVRKADWAHRIKELVYVRYQQAEQIGQVTDDPNTHTPASLHEAFEPPSETKRLAEKLEIHLVGRGRFLAEAARLRRGRQAVARIKLERLYPSLQE